MSTATVKPADALQDKITSLEKQIAEFSAVHAKAMQPVYGSLGFGNGNARASAGPGFGNPRNWATARDHSAEGMGGFKSFGHFLRDVRTAAVERTTSPILGSWHQKANADGLNETVGSEGGFLVPPEFSSELLMRVYDNDLLSRTRAYPCTGNSLSLVAIDETSRANGSRFGGVQAYWESEAAVFTASQPAFNRVELKLKKLIALCYVTDELIADSGIALQQVLLDLYAQEIAFKVGDAVINGSGAGQPQGVLNAPALVSVSKETGQSSASLLYENINKMWSRMYAPSRQNAAWFINQDVEPALDGLAISVGTGGLPVYLPPGGVSEKPYATLKGRPVIPIEFAATLGTVGDIMLLDLSQMLTLRKGEAQTDSSIHVKFDTFQTAFRTIFRMDASSHWASALTPYKGSNSLSPFVALATRA